MSPLPVLASAFLSLNSLALAQNPAVPHFTEVSGSVGLRGFYLPANPFGWGTMNISIMGGGVAVGDFNADGWQDVYVVTGGVFGDQLFINNGDGTFSDRAASAGVAAPHLGMGASVGDCDGDGDVDIFVTSVGPANAAATAGAHILWRNNGDLTFTNVALQAGVNRTSPTLPDGLGSTFGDYDLDGDLDLFVSGWIPTSDGNRLFRNDGDGTFSDVTVAAGVFEAGVHGFSPQLLDMDGDRYPELLLAADFGTSRYYVNNGDGTFSEATASSGLGLDGNGMGQCTGDFDGDGLFDWYVTSIHSLNSGQAGVPGTGNMLYRNNGAHNYAEISVAAGVNDGGWGWGAVAADFNNDGLLDLAETNGFKQFNGLGVQEWLDESSYMWLNSGGANFTEASHAAGFTHRGTGRGLARLDFDNDGDQDLLVVTNAGRHKLYRNDGAGSGAHWLRITLDTQASPYLAPDGIGSRVVCNVAGTEQLRCVDSGCSYLSTSELLVHFGLRGMSSATHLRVEWSNGRVTYLDEVPADQTIVVTFCPGDWNGRDGITSQDYDDFRNDWLACSADFNSDGTTDVLDFIEFQAAYSAGCP